MARRRGVEGMSRDRRNGLGSGLDGRLVAMTALVLSLTLVAGARTLAADDELRGVLG